jgi:hypothetical protein
VGSNIHNVSRTVEPQPGLWQFNFNNKKKKKSDLWKRAETKGAHVRNRIDTGRRHATVLATNAI